MNNPKSVALGWGVLTIAAAGSFYYARKEINARRLEQAQKGQRGPAKEWYERLEERPTSSTTSKETDAGSPGTNTGKDTSQKGGKPS
ncbi:hypothetical protein CPB86DRAFT_781655 [Serendipita vermifera]|nr:hypothetical protein CPB86DRAFT_781655 [Serendipita vermifera]